MVGKCARSVSILADYMNKTPEVKNFISSWTSTIQFDLTGEDPFGLEFSQDGDIHFKNGRLENPDVVFYCKADLFFQILTGRADQDEAFSSGLVEVKGSIIDSVRFRHAAELTQEKHSTLFTTLRAFSRFV